MLIQKEAKRCAIFLFYDPDGVVDRYIVEMLRDLRRDVKYILTVVNGYVTAEGRMLLEKYSDEVLMHLNIGFDVGGYRAGLFHIGFDKLMDYDEFMMFNYTYFGPVYPMHEVFEEMDGKDLDFWGLTKHHKVNGDPFLGKISYGYMPEHINSHFIAIRRSLFATKDYQDFMIDLQDPESYVDSITRYEAIFTKHFEDLGYKWAVYVDTDRLEGVFFAPFMYGVAELLKKDRCPIVKRRSFFTDYLPFLQNTAGESSGIAYRVLKEETDYDTTMIWENVMRLENQADVHQAVHLNYFPDAYLSERDMSCEDEVNVCIFGDESVSDMLSLSYKDALANIKGVHRFDSEKSLARQLKTACECADKSCYTLIINMPDMAAEPEPKSNAASLLYRETENLCGTEAVIANILREFDNDRSLGLMVSPVPDFGSYFAMLGDGWAGRFDQTKEVLQKIGADVHLKKSQNHPVFPFGGSFWIRTKLLRTVSEMMAQSEVDDALLERLLLPYLVQAKRCFTGSALSSRYAAIEMTNLDYSMRENNRMVFDKFGPDYFEIELKRIRREI